MPERPARRAICPIVVGRNDELALLFKPPVFDGSTTRGLYDSTTADVDRRHVPLPAPGAVHDVHELAPVFVAENMRAMNSLVSRGTSGWTRSPMAATWTTWRLSAWSPSPRPTG